MGPHGPLLTGYALSDIMIGEVHVQNLQQDLEKSYRSMFAVQLSADAQPACFSSCGTDVSTAVIKDGFCYSDSKCVANGAMSVSTPCFQCDSAVSQTELIDMVWDVPVFQHSSWNGGMVEWWNAGMHECMNA